MLEITITILGLIQGVLAMLNKRINWLVYAVQMALLVVFSWFAHLYGDTLQNFAYFFVCVIGWFMWKKDSPAEKITVGTSFNRIMWLIIIATLTLAGGFTLSATDDPLPYVDSFTTVTTIAGLLLMMAHRLETWVIWFFNDIAYMYQYFNLPDQAIYLFGLYVIWTIFAVATFINWLRIYNKEHPEIDEPTYYTGME